MVFAIKTVQLRLNYIMYNRFFVFRLNERINMHIENFTDSFARFVTKLTGNRLNKHTIKCSEHQAGGVIR